MNKRLLMLNGLAILAVVANHATNKGYLAMFWWTDRYWNVSVPNYDQIGSLGYYLLVALQKLTVFSVPAFMIVSGIFLTYMARGSQSRLTYPVVLRRVLNLLPPYLLWTSMYYLLDFLLGGRRELAEILSGFLWYGDAPYFFVPLLIFYYLLAPVLAPLAQKHWKPLLAAAALVLTASVLRSYLTLAHLEVEREAWPLYLKLLPSGQIPEYIFYFVLGIVMGFHLPQVKEMLARFRWLLLGILVAAGALAVVESELVYRATQEMFWRSLTLSLPTAIYTITFSLAFIAFEQSYLPFSNQLFKLGGSSLGIYLIHKLPLTVLPKIIYHVLPWIMAFQYLYQPLLVAVSVATPLILMLLVRRTPVKPAYRVLFG